MMRLMVEIECVGKIANAFDKATGSSDGLQPEQVDLNYVHALNEPHLHEIRVVLRALCRNPCTLITMIPLTTSLCITVPEASPNMRERSTSRSYHVSSMKVALSTPPSLIIKPTFALLSRLLGLIVFSI
uniref:Uncharacterized protein n=1 Tax=Tanacetum cinerariifolium TaxID=118510 RepID=A0A6L2NMY7_TANCI|nr:hypothetical protein [Tanacetum cinerariifolium]